VRLKSGLRRLTGLPVSAILSLIPGKLWIVEGWLRSVVHPRCRIGLGARPRRRLAVESRLIRQELNVLLRLSIPYFQRSFQFFLVAVKLCVLAAAAQGRGFEFNRDIRPILSDKCYRNGSARMARARSFSSNLET